jgi:hypothetical protein
MKILQKIIFTIVGVILFAILALVISDFRNPSYSQIKLSCEEAIAKSPHSKTLEEWMNQSNIPKSRRGDGILNEETRELAISQGRLRDPTNKAVSYKYFQITVRGGYIARHVCYGYFYISTEGDIIDYDIYDINYGM